jgi:hypothetical protein
MVAAAGAPGHEPGAVRRVRFAEYAFDHALQVAEQIAPMVLWIDEMENSFGYDSDHAQGNNPNIFSSFLTWMQEKPAGVFVVATANRIEKLPAEVIRKGRFDQLFFLDLPTEEERTRIIEIHLRAAGADPAAFNLKTLAVVTRNWSGAEIEQAIKAAVGACVAGAARVQRARRVVEHLAHRAAVAHDGRADQGLAQLVAGARDAGVAQGRGEYERAAARAGYVAEHFAETNSVSDARSLQQQALALAAQPPRRLPRPLRG